MPKLRAIRNYRHDPRNLVFEAGTVFDATEEQAAYLLADAPGCFERVTKAPAEPPANKAILDAPERKEASDDLTVIGGISRVKARQLAAMGITTFAALASADPESLTDIRGVGEATASEWIAAVKERL